MESWRVLILISVCVIRRGYAQVFESSPGLVKVHEGEDVDLIWKTTKDITPANLYRTFYHTSVRGQNNRLLEVAFGKVFTYNECAGHRCVLLNGTHETGIRIPSITTADVRSKYIIYLSIRNGQNGMDEDAAIYVYPLLNKAQLTSDSDDVTEGDDLRLTCACVSTSPPKDMRSDVPMTYKWTRDDQDVDPDDPPDRHSFPASDHSVLKISPVKKRDYDASYKCIGQEQGSRLPSDASKAYVIDVRCE
ncbi:hypothetical protein CAPTEDRAFT_221457 [Capitella teleta]|uniref:Ig-like domain-containing protein n=1 Tax=Capitella teleta TaxID=283909 RepID=R7TV77_CAPTE|nr:hypothetical protein CAPTEDRAFT_221457 [Capitella teleta]|eukprot:ELT97492.1 hypothetical protein CAPTEDRAFT_221457 [Capitella teleta]